MDDGVSARHTDNVTVHSRWTADLESAAVLIGPVDERTLAAARQLIAAGYRVNPSARHLDIDDVDAQLLRRLVQGRTVAEIADELGYTRRHVHRLLARLYAHIRAPNRIEATAFAIRSGIR